MSSLHCFVVLAVLGSTLALSGEYVPKSFYTINENGEKSDVIYLRKSISPRFRRSPSGVEGAISYEVPADIAGMVEAGLSNTFQQLRHLANEAGAQGGGGAAFSGSYSNAGGPGVGGGGPVLHSRFSENAGGSERELVTGGNGRVHASASAQGPHGAASFSSSSVDSNGQIHYETQARKF